MKIEKVDGNQIRIIITSADLADFNVSMEKLTPDSPELHTFLFRIMERVKLETDFNPYTGQIMVEATPFLDGVTLLVTKIGENKERRKIKNVRAVKKPHVLRTGIYAFDTFEAMCGALKAANEEWLCGGALYEMENTYYLLVHTDDDYRKYHAVFSEFCSKSDYSSEFDRFLDEHAKMIAKKAALCEMAAQIRELC